MAIVAMDYNAGLPRDLDVTPIFTDLMKASIGQSSIYLKAKETILDYVEKGHLTERERAEVLSKNISDLAGNMTAQALQAAVQIAKENRDAPVVYQKAVEDTKLTNAQMQKTIVDANKGDKDIELSIMAIKKAQSELYRDYGVIAPKLPASVENLSLDADFRDYGIKHESVQMAQGNLYNSLATSYRQNGLVTGIDYDNLGNPLSTAIGNGSGLTYWQTRVAERNERGFDDNMRQHVANSSATLASMLLSSEEAGLVDDAEAVLAKWGTAVNYLNISANKPAGDLVLSVGTTLSVSAGISISGSTVNILSGSTVTVVLTKVSGAIGSSTRIDGIIGLVQMDASWSITKAVSGITSGDVYTATAEVTDARGVQSIESVNVTVTA